VNFVRLQPAPRPRTLAVAFSADSRTSATAGNDRRIKLWDPASGRLRHTMTGNTG